MDYLKLCFTIIGLFLLSPGNDTEINPDHNNLYEDTQDAIPVLNFGTFHMGFTTDANTTEFDEHDRENQKKVHEIAQLISDFDPTVIVVETRPDQNESLREAYHNYKENPDMFVENPTEIELLAFELGRLSVTTTK